MRIPRHRPLGCAEGAKICLTGVIEQRDNQGLRSVAQSRMVTLYVRDCGHFCRYEPLRGRSKQFKTKLGDCCRCSSDIRANWCSGCRNRRRLKDLTERG